MTTPERETLRPDSLEALQEAIAGALATGKALEVVGGGSKRHYGRPVRAERTLRLDGLRGIVTYEPRELIVILRPGTPLAELEKALEAEGQMLAFEPPHWGERATVGGALACNLAGPRRFKAGAARDHLLGFQAVSGRGEAIRAGGRVVKNVTGYDLSKLMCGSFGTLALLTEVCLKVLPRPEAERTLVVVERDDAAGVALLIQASRTAHDVSGLAHLPRSATLPPALAGMDWGGMTLIRVEGPPPSVAYRAERLAELAGPGTSFLEGEASRSVWRSIREVEPVAPAEGESLWRFVVPPTAAVALVEELREAGPLRAAFDWGGGLVWASLAAGEDFHAPHRAAAHAGGHARLVRPGAPVAEDDPVFPNLDPVRLRLQVNLKQAFDPARILNPGKLYRDL